MFEFRPEFHIDFHLEVVWPKLKGAFRGLGAALKGLVLPGEAGVGRNRRRASRRRARLFGWRLAALLVAAALLLLL